MMRIGLAVAATLSAMLACAASAQEADDQPVVVELYTSQGCSSCPPADELLHELAGREDVLALALHVDYWDYIGWKDNFADPAFTKRQRGYVHAAGGSTVYTPQMIVSGENHVIGFRPMELADLIQSHRAEPDPVAVELSREGDRLKVSAHPVDGPVGPVVVQIVSFAPEREVDIQRGENAGRTISYANVVTAWEEIARWDGRGTFEADAEATHGMHAAVILQKPDYGPVVAAARAR